MPVNIPGHLKKSAKEYISTLDEDVKRRITGYTNTGYEDINRQMMEYKGPDFVGMNEFDLRTLKIIESALEGAPDLEKPVTVYRGMNVTKELSESLLKDFENRVTSGEEFQMPTLVSTSLYPGVATIFSDRTKGSERATGNVPIVFSIKAKRGLYVEGLRYKSKTKSSEPEHELLQSYKTKYKVIGVSDAEFVGGFPKQNGVRKVVYLEEV